MARERGATGVGDWEADLSTPLVERIARLVQACGREALEEVPLFD